jgi:ubiquinone/menaquinone biosynthesis C-methylase UbiE
MAGMNWFWRAVCAPDCSDSCQTNCPGCYAMADEWQRDGVVTTVTGKPAPKFRWRNLGLLWACWSRSASARMMARLNPRHWGRRGATTGSVGSAPAQSGGCGCHTASAQGGLPAVDMGITLTGARSGKPAPGDTVRGEVRRYYDLQAKGVRSAGDACCGGATGLPEEVNCTTEYPADDLRSVPVDAITASLGCGNPFERANLRPGEVVLDLGSGGGLDALVAARRVGTDGHVFGVDMSEEMISLAQTNAASAGAENVAFLKGDMESIPLPRASVDVIISNCVVNLVPDKQKALREAHRVLRPDGRLAISDIVTRLPVPAEMKSDLAAWAACIGGALTSGEYEQHLIDAGFVDIEIERHREYTAQDAELAGVAPILERAGLADALALGFANTSIRARKGDGLGTPERVLAPSSASSRQ